MLNRAVWGTAVIFTGSWFAGYLFAQGSAKLPGNLPGAFTFIPEADVEKVQQAIENGLPNDSPVRMVDISGRFDLGVYTLNSRPTKPPEPGTPIMGWYHNDIAEVYIIASGAGTWRVGGEIENPRRTTLMADRSRRCAVQAWSACSRVLPIRRSRPETY